MNEITQTNLNIIPAEDIEYLTKQSTAEIGKIVAGMTSLMHDTDTRVEKLESQGWFQRMCKTITGKNKATKEEIRQNNDKLNAYMSEALSALYEKQLIDDKIIMNLGLQMNMLYADHNQLKQQLGVFAAKLNEKIESLDNFHLLVEEINLGHYTQLAPVLAICEITSLFDERILREERKLNILREALEKQDIINDNEIAVTDYLNDIFKISAENVGQIVMELGTICEKSPIAQLLLGITENYHYLSETAKKMKKKSAIVEHVLNEYEIDDSATFSTRDIYEDFVKAKIEVYENCKNCVGGSSGEETADALYADAEKAYNKKDNERAMMVCSAGDIVNIFRGRISGAQLFKKNFINSAASVAGGISGWTGGATVGAALGSVVPVVGNVVGGLVGGVIGAMGGSTAASKVSAAVIDGFIEDDAEEMVSIIEKEFQTLSADYLINKDEAEKIVENLAKKIDGGTLKDMYAVNEKRTFARELLLPCIEQVTNHRNYIHMPTEEQMTFGLRRVSDNTGTDGTLVAK